MPEHQTTFTSTFTPSNLLLCVTCGTQYDVDLSTPLESCRICEDPRQYVPPSGQRWTSLAQEQGRHENRFEPCPDDDRITFITTEPKLGIGQRAILLRTPHGTILWDLLAYLDGATVARLRALDHGRGPAAILISHPHFYTTHLDWAAALGCPVYCHAADARWLTRVDPPSPPSPPDRRLRRLLDTPLAHASPILPGLAAVRVGGHFDGSLVLYWDEGATLFTADSLMIVPSALNPPSSSSPVATRSTFAFMWSYPNMIPLDPSAVHTIWTALKGLRFTRAFGGFPGQDLVPHRHQGDEGKEEKDLRPRLLESVRIHVRHAGHERHPVLAEEVPRESEG